MRKGKHVVIGLLAVLMIGLIGTANGGFIPKARIDSPFASQECQAPQAPIRTGTSENLVRTNAFTISAAPDEGVLDPIRIKQSGYQTTDAKRGRTDTGANTVSSIAIDEGNGWFVNNTAVEVSNLKHLYGVNGTFEDGVDPWTNYTVDGGGNTQIPGYDSDGEYITCRNVGDYKWSGKHTWEHSSGSEVGFEQAVNNIAGELVFDLRFDFRYVTGPIDPEGDNGLPGVIGVFYQVNDDAGVMYEGWYYPMETNVDSRDAWNSHQHTFTIPVAWNEFSFALGLYLAGSITLDNVTDYDDDPLAEADGIEHAQNLTIYIDNVEFTGSETPTFESVDLTFTAGAFSEAIIGSGVGTAFISNPSYWTTDPLDVQITSNTSVIFTYSVTSLFHRYINSSWTTDLSKEGVHYSISAGQSSDLSIFTYIAPSAEYDGATVDLLYPKDWENATVLDPLSIDITNNCSISSERIHIPNSEMGRSGWWEINLQSPNYARDVSIQVQNESTEQWSESSLFRAGNTTRVQVEIGTALGNPTDGSPVNITWMLPNSTLWAYDSISTMINGVVNSSHWILGGANTSAGQWEVIALWTNGTEIAYDYAVFDMHHTASLTPREALVETDTGLLITNMLYYVDEDTADFILDASANVVANWSGSTITFQANPIHNWWQADFNTALVGAGQFVVVVNASIPFYDDVTCQFTIVSTHRTNFDLTSVGALPTEVGLHEVLTINMRYELEAGTGIEGASIQMDYSGPTDGLQYLGQSSSSPGNYSVNVTNSKAGTYTVTLTISKPYHYNKSDSFTLIVGETGTDLTALNGTADFMDMGGSYRLVLQYVNSTGDGLASADVEIISVTPSTGLAILPGPYGGNGRYSFDLTPSSAGTYTLIIRANLTNHVTQIVSFTLTASDIATILTIDSSGATVSVWENHSVLLTFRDELANGVPGATISILDLPSSITFVYEDLSGGFYNVSIVSSMPGTYQLAFKAHKANHLNSTVGFTLIVKGFAADLMTLNGTADFVTYGNSYSLILRYENGTGFGITGADVDIIDITPTNGLGFGNTTDEGNGYYSIVLNPTTADIFTLLIRANFTEYSTQIVSFTLTVREISTILTLDAAGATISVDQDYTAQVTFRDDSLNGLESATLLVLNPPSGLSFSVAELSDGQYTITLTPSTIGTYVFAIRATLSNYLNSTVGFTLVVRTIPTELRIAENLVSDSIYFTEEYNLTLVYVRTDTGLNISSANLVVSTLPAEGLSVTVTKVGDLYFLGFTADSIGKWQVFFTANKTDCVNGFIEFELEVLPVAIEIDIFQGLSAVEGAHNTLSLWLAESVTGNPVPGATVEYQLISETGPGEIQSMSESEPGRYSVSFQMPSFESTTYVRIYVTIENYDIDADYYEAQLNPILSEIEALNRTIRRYSPYIAIMGIAALGYAGRRAYIRRQRRRYIDAMVVKRRFDDVKSLLGVIVLHKHTGIPIYSKMLKEGLDELLVSGFVSAISTFRSEFNVSQENWVVTPISDIIRTVATENLLCAFISLAPPSKGQELRMVEFAEAIGFVFDKMYPEVPLTTIEPETEAQFTAFFDDIMDGRFLRDYTVSEGKSFPRKTKCIEERIHRIDDEDGFDLEELASEMTSCGLEEARVYTIIMDAIEMGNLALASIGEIRTDTAFDSSDESDILKAEPESEESETPIEIKVKTVEFQPETSEEERFLEDVESLLSKEDDDKEEE